MNVLIHVLTVVLYAAKLSDGLLSYNCKLQVPKKNSLMDKDVGGIRFKGERCLLLLIVYDRSGKDVQFLWNSCTKSHDSILYHHSSFQKDFVYDYIKDLTESLNYISQDCVNSFRRLNSTMTEFFEHKLTNTTNKRLARDVTVLIHPGTKYCGVDNIADSYDDIGEEPADICCREHDNCKLWIGASDTKYGLTNNNTFIVMSHCHCDKKFQWCLRKIKKIYGAESEADNVFSWFFGTLGMQCFMFTKQPVCTKTKQICSGWLVQSCVEECVSYRYRYQAAQATIEQGEIILGKP